eukprot:TRINITY_DN39820_c0_g1_i1.p1 TRINITY_DN39820_c0_g1~~TRINITY_DN39820_c0_g1_i1.p1  ORF type:complete len:1502 (-),score=293.44 TRINITY_DN39820_c0_g1_i1:200-4705(-)
MTFLRGDVVRIGREFCAGLPADGYLVLRTEEVVVVEYVGVSGDENGWLFGYNWEVPDEHGWFPSSAVAGRLLKGASIRTELATSGIALNDTSFKLPPPGLDIGPPPRANSRAAVAHALDAAKSLPVSSLLPDLRALVAAHRLIIINAATGSGKSTLVPLALAEQCLQESRSCRILVTQPRRLAAKGLAWHVARQTHTELGDVVGYRVGNDRNDRQAYIVYVTTGHLLEALVHNPAHFQSFSHIVLDEVHERFVEADFLMALLRLQLSRPESIRKRIVVMSATLQRSLVDFFQPLLLPTPLNAEPGQLRLPEAAAHTVEDFGWEDMRKRWPKLLLRTVAGNCMGEPAFADFKPSALQKAGSHHSHRRRSEQLQRLCKELTPICARLLCELHRSGGSNVQLVFLPGMEQLMDLHAAFLEEANRRASERQKTLRCFLLHSTLEEELYKGALEPLSPDEWRVVLSTSMAESSLTLPGVDVVVDFGMQRVNIYDDDARMSSLVTDWASRASLQQRRGRTGRTNAGKYLQLFPKGVLDELPQFDDSGVQRAPLTRITLEAAHLATALNTQPVVRAGLPVRVSSRDAVDVAAFWDARRGGWCLSAKETGAEGGEVVDDSALVALPVDARTILGLLPSAPREARIRSAAVELRELGALGANDCPTVIGAACLRLPVDIPLGRLVALGCFLGCAVDAVILAAALSLSPSCDVMRTPWNAAGRLDPTDLMLLRQTVETRKKADAGRLSEPLMLHALCMEWLRCGGGCLGQAPQHVPWRKVVHLRLWSQFTEKLVELGASLLRLLPSSSLQAMNLYRVLQRARGSPVTLPTLEGTSRRLVALLTWALAPLGFVAVGQTPALYNDGGKYAAFVKTVQQYGGQVQKSFLWSKSAQAACREVALACGAQLTWSAVQQEDLLLGLGGDASEPGEQLPTSGEVLCRLCGPFNGKQTTIALSGNRQVTVAAARHPAMLNWYVPKALGSGLLEVQLSWRSQLDTAICLPQPRHRRSFSRPKRFLVACGGEAHCSGGGKTVALRGVTALPGDDGGRSAVLWLLAAGVPRDGKLVAFAAPGGSLQPGDYEVRALQLWQRTICFPSSDPLLASDLEAVNTYRRSLSALQQRLPHWLVGKWTVEGTSRHYFIEHLGHLAEEAHVGCAAGGRRHIAVSVRSDSEELFKLEQQSTKHGRWRVVRCDSHADGSCCDAPLDGWWCDDEGGELRWQGGARWLRADAYHEERPLLDSLRADVVRAYREAAEHLLAITEDRGGESVAQRLPARLVPLLREAGAPAREVEKPADASRDGDAQSSGAPLDLELVRRYMARFTSRLQSELPEALLAEAGSVNGDGAEEAYELESDEDDAENEDWWLEASSQAQMSEEFVQHLAMQEDWDPRQSQQLVFTESILALPMTPMCSECQMDGKKFSKSQLARRPHERRCTDCVSKGQTGAKKAMTSLTLGAKRQPLQDAASTSTSSACSACGKRLSAENCCATQRQLLPSRRRCNECLAAKSRHDGQ